MLIGFIGKGVVGGAMYDVFSEIYNTCFYDKKNIDTNISDVIKSDIIFICVPTPTDDQNKCNLSILNGIMDELHNLNFKGVICIKSTVIPNTTANYIDKYNNDKICFCPEFLRERYAYDDFKYNNKICIIGTINEEVYLLIKYIHQPICTEFRKVIPTEAELTKYFQNVYNTNKIIFANAFYEICKSKNIIYNDIIDNLSIRNSIDTQYLRCDEGLRGPSGNCLVKDTLAFNEYIKSLNNNSTIIQAIVNDMDLYPKTNR